MNNLDVLIFIGKFGLISSLPSLSILSSKYSNASFEFRKAYQGMQKWMWARPLLRLALLRNNFSGLYFSWESIMSVEFDTTIEFNCRKILLIFPIEHGIKTLFLYLFLYPWLAAFSYYILNTQGGLGLYLKLIWKSLILPFSIRFEWCCKWIG